MSAAGATVAQVIEAVRDGRAVMAPETAGYIILAVADLLARAPRVVDAYQCGLLVEGGNVVLKPTKAPGTPEEAEASARKLFRMLLAVSSGAAPALHAVAARAAVGDLQALASEIESALVPLNRAAARRALSRLARETLRPPAAPKAPSDAPPPNEDESAVPMQLDRPSWQAAAMPSMRPTGAKKPPALPVVEDDLVSAIQEARKSMPPRRAPAERPEPTPAGITATDTVTQVDDVTDVDEESGRSQPSAAPPFAQTEPTPPPDGDPSSALPPAVDEPAASPAPARAATPAPARAATPAPARAATPLPARAATPEPARAATPEPARAATPEPAPASEPSAEPAPASEPAPRPSKAPVARPPRPGSAARDTPAASPTPSPADANAKALLSTVSGRPSGPPQLGADQLLESFMAHTTRRERDVAADLKRMVDVEPTPPPPGSPPSAPGPANEPATADRADPGKDEGATELLGSTPPPGAPAQASPARKRPSGVPYAFLAFLAAAAAGAFAVWRFGVPAGLLPNAFEPERPMAPPAPPAAAVLPPAPCRARIVVNDLGAETDVFLKAGTAPLELQRTLPTATIEVVASKDGFAPVRAAVPASAAWSIANGAAHCDLSIDLQKHAADAGAIDRGADAGTANAQAGRGHAGVVRVATTPPGAEIWTLAARGPEAKIDGLPCGAPADLFLIGSYDAGRQLRSRLHIEASQFTPDSSGIPTARANARQAITQ
jgi:hypothetical protein